MTHQNFITAALQSPRLSCCSSQCHPRSKSPKICSRTRTCAAQPPATLTPRYHASASETHCLNHSTLLPMGSNITNFQVETAATIYDGLLNFPFYKQPYNHWAIRAEGRLGTCLRTRVRARGACRQRDQGCLYVRALHTQVHDSSISS
jgi:hypothetical protein